MKKLTFIIALFLLFNNAMFAQVAINSDASLPDNSAMLDVKSTTKGMLVPRMTISDRNAISNPATGLLVFCTDNNAYYTNKGTPASPNWIMTSTQWLQNGNDIWYSAGKIGIGSISPAWTVDVAGDINFTGTLRKNGVAVVTGVSTVTATSPLSSSGGSGPNITISQANGTSPGFLSSSDWNTFNNKQNTLTLGNVTSGDMTITGGNGAVVGTGLGLTINKGSMTSSDMTITGGTNAVLGSGTALAIKKGNLTEVTSSVLTITSGSNAVLGTGTTIQVQQAGASQSGYLGSTDWNTFNNKVSSQWLTNSSNIYYNLGNVGIGTTNPTYKLDVSGAGHFATGVTGNNTTPYTAAVFGNNSAADHDYGIYGISNTSTGIAIYGYANSGLAGYFSGNVTVSGIIQPGNIKYNNGTNLLHTIGESYGGGIVFYVYDGGQHGLIAPTSDQNVGIRWYGGSNTYTRARANGVGAGLKNTAIIIANQGPVDGSGFAASMCSDYSITVNGVTYGDWYLPSETELYLLYLQRSVVGGFAAGGYWSSTEINQTSAWVQYFDDGSQFYYPKDYTYHVRAIRAF